MSRKPVLLSFLLIAALSVPFATAYGADKKPVAGKAVAAPKTMNSAAMVNGVPITVQELNKAFTAFKNSPQGAQLPAGKEAEVKGFLLDQLISGELLYQQANASPPKNLEAMIDENIKGLQESRFKNRQEMLSSLKQQGITEKDLREAMRRNIVVGHYVDTKVAPGQQVSAAEIKAFYDNNPQLFEQPEQVRASHILIPLDPKATAKERTAAISKANELLKQLKAGADFTKLARENSSCPSSQQGGDLGYFAKGQMVKPFENKAFAMKPGEVSDVVETQFGLHIIKLAEKRPAGKIPFNDVKEQLEAELKHQKVNEAVEKTIADLRKNAKIETFIK